MAEIFINFERSSMWRPQISDLADKIQLQLSKSNDERYEGHSFSNDYKKIMLTLGSKNAQETLNTIIHVFKNSPDIISPYAEIEYPDNKKVRIEL